MPPPPLTLGRRRQASMSKRATLGKETSGGNPVSAAAHDQLSDALRTSAGGGFRVALPMARRIFRGIVLLSACLATGVGGASEGLPAAPASSSPMPARQTAALQGTLLRTGTEHAGSPDISPPLEENSQPTPSDSRDGISQAARWFGVLGFALFMLRARRHR